MYFESSFGIKDFITIITRVGFMHFLSVDQHSTVSFHATFYQITIQDKLNLNLYSFDLNFKSYYCSLIPESRAPTKIYSYQTNLKLALLNLALTALACIF